MRELFLVLEKGKIYIIIMIIITIVLVCYIGYRAAYDFSYNKTIENHLK